MEALERLASFLGTLFVKHEITETDEKVLAAAAKRRPKLKGEWGVGGPSGVATGTPGLLG